MSSVGFGYCVLAESQPDKSDLLAGSVECGIQRSAPQRPENGGVELFSHPQEIVHECGSMIVVLVVSELLDVVQL
jgi:hypothetical protein